MCIISVFKRGRRPDNATIQRMMTTNRDGVGVAWNTGKNVYFKKGFTDAGAVEKFIKRLTHTDGVRDIVFHARIGTSGGISPQKCHPYPLSGDAHQLDKVNYGGGAPVVFHNGVFSIDIDAGLNDSQTFVKNMLYPLHKSDPRGLMNGKYDELIEMAVHGSRLVIMYPDGFRAYGAGWQEEPEAWYSNTGYKAYAYSYGWDEWDPDEEWDEFNAYRKKGGTLSFFVWRRERDMKKANNAMGGAKV